MNAVECILCCVEWNEGLIITAEAARMDRCEVVHSIMTLHHSLKNPLD